MKTVLLVVDMQNDFCLPSGSLYVPGAEKDVERLSRLIKEKMTVIDKIILTADEHHVMDIAHPSYWKNKRGEHPDRGMPSERKGMGLRRPAVILNPERYRPCAGNGRLLRSEGRG